MMGRTAWIAGLMSVALAPWARAQAPPVALPSGGAGALAGAAEAVATAGTGGVGGATAVAAAAPQKTIFGMFGLSKANIHACKAALCQTQLGLMLNNMATGPAAKFSAGLVPPLCPPLSPAQIAGLPGGPQGAQAVAAKVKASEADAKARVAAIEYLGTVDCKRWPDVTQAIMVALREDPNECVRYAAARVLNSGCCCSQKMIESLKACVSGTEADGKPAESSTRVKAAAFTALQGCLMRIPPDLPAEVPPPPVAPERGPAPPPLPLVKPEGPTALAARDADGQPASYKIAPRAPTFDERLRRKTFTQTVEEARRTLQQVAETAQPPATLPTGRQSVLNALIKARENVNNHKATRSSNPSAATAPAPAPAAGAFPAPPPPETDSAVRQSSHAVPLSQSARGAETLEPVAPGRDGRPAGQSSPSKRGLLGLLIRTNSGAESH